MEIKDLKRGTRVQLPFEEKGEVVDTISTRIYLLPNKKLLSYAYTNIL